jgi:hypothetical protein
MPGYGVNFKRALALTSALALAAPPARAEPASTADYNAPSSERRFIDYARAAANATLVNWTLWQIAWLRDKDWAPVTRDNWRENIEAGFTFDQDILQTNFFGHPYHGGLLFNGARGAGLSFWESTLYTFGSSFVWEVFAEREKPALNDLAVTVLGGIMLGEMTHRLSSELLDDSSSGTERALREVAGALVDPVRGFDRLTTGWATRTGRRPRRNVLGVDFEIGVDIVSADEQRGVHHARRAGLLLAISADYGNLVPRRGRSTFDPFEFFELYAAANLLSGPLQGAHVYASGLLHGESLPLSRRPRERRDNDVFGLAMNYEYVGTNFATYSGVGAGPVNHLVMRLANGRSVRLSAGFDFVPILGASSTEVGSSERDYNMALGVSPWSGLRLKLDGFGELGLRTRHYVARVVDGQAGTEAIGSMRLWYELPLFMGLGIGIAPTLVYRRGHYVSEPSYAAQQFSTQLYAIASPVR